ncbi:hypothetical protein [Rhizobium sp. BK376]|uniref:COG4705 family protein n=1 Tax=Rhizobium sp. BK376 TaxID=2512149 RepID=UPI0010433D9A|nr:hypothetical protein [Rhizobium sp. BK376]TCR85255.1 putative membrane-anchored protein [Rhizobium sp. BK376]
MNFAEQIAPDSNVRQRDTQKVARVTLAFWIMKILATTLGETAGDFVSMTLNLGYYVGFAITFTVLIVVLFFQISFRHLRPAIFWLGIVSTTTAGTEVSDLMDRSFGLGYLWGSVILALGLAATFAIWYRRDPKLDVDAIASRDIEILFWIAVIFSNSLGTAFGDFLSDNLGLGYVSGALVTAAVIGIVVALHYTTRINHVILFWVAFIFTRPFGATFGDFLTKPVKDGALNLPRGEASLINVGLLFTVLVVAGLLHRYRNPSDDRRIL